MKTLVTAAALAVAGVQVQAATVNFTYKSGPLKVGISCEANYAEGCLEPQIDLPAAFHSVSFEVPIAFETDAVRFVDGIGTIAWDSYEFYDGETIGLADPIRLVDETSGEVYIDRATDWALRSLELKVDASMTVIETIFESEFYSYVGPLWYVDIRPTGPLVTWWGYDPSLTSEFHLMNFARIDESPAPVPLPASAPMLLLAWAGLAALRRRRN